jgi:hypothetical protein
MRDEIMEELWAIRDALAAESKNDIHEIARHFMRGVPDPRLLITKPEATEAQPSGDGPQTPSDERPHLGKAAYLVTV